MQPGTIGLNRVQREWARVGLNLDIFVKHFSVPAGYDLGSITFEVDFYQKPSATQPIREVKGDELEA